VPQLSELDRSYQGRRVVVLGASGFIGRWVARALGASGAELYLLVRQRREVEQFFGQSTLPGHFIELDLRDTGAVWRCFRQIKPALTFNLAGYGVDRAERDEQMAYQINADLVRTVAEIVAETRDPAWSGQDFVHVGSALEYGVIGGNLAEDSTPQPTTLYGQSKLAGTLALAESCQKHHLKGLTARLFTVYGPGEHPGRLLPSLVETAKTGHFLALTAGTQKRDFTYVEDVAEGLLRLGLGSAQPGEIVNLATGQLTSVRSFIQIAAQVLQIPNDRLEFGAIPIRAEEMEHAPVSIVRLRRLIAWTPSTHIAEGIRRTGAQCDP
jgi:UDP-glucose 4-epimerase